MSGFIQPISQESTKSLGITTDYMPRAVVRLVLHMIGWSKMNERLPDMTPNRMLLGVSVLPQNLLF